MMLDVHAGSATAAPALPEDAVRDVLADMRTVLNIPTDWWGEDNVVACTDDPELAAQAADELARRDLGTGYLSVAGGAVVEGPHEVVLTSSTDAESIGWRPAGASDEYALLMCVIRPVPVRRPEPAAADTDLVDASSRRWGWR
jgi:hypothetical protein